MRLFALDNPPHCDRHIGAARWLVPRRQNIPELLEQGAGTPAEVRANLREMWRINRYLGGLNALTAQLFPRLRRLWHSENRPLSVVDVGTGSGEVARHIGHWAQRQHIELTVLGLDISVRNLAFAAENTASTDNVQLLQADATALPFAPHQIDYYISSLVLHHFSPAEVITLLCHTYTRSRYGIVMNDLTRGHLPTIGFRLIQPFFARNYLTRHDGLVSIHRAYTPGELVQLATEAGIEQPRVIYAFPFRMTLVAEKPHG